MSESANLPIPFDIVLKIAYSLRSSSSLHTLCNLSLVSKEAHAIINPLVYHTMVFDERTLNSFFQPLLGTYTALRDQASPPDVREDYSRSWVRGPRVMLDETMKAARLDDAERALKTLTFVRLHNNTLVKKLVLRPDYCSLADALALDTILSASKTPFFPACDTLCYSSSGDGETDLETIAGNIEHRLHSRQSACKGALPSDRETRETEMARGSLATRLGAIRYLCVPAGVSLGGLQFARSRDPEQAVSSPVPDQPMMGSITCHGGVSFNLLEPVRHAKLVYNISLRHAIGALYGELPLFTEQEIVDDIRIALLRADQNDRNHDILETWELCVDKPSYEKRTEAEYVTALRRSVLGTFAEWLEYGRPSEFSFDEDRYAALNQKVIFTPMTQATPCVVCGELYSEKKLEKLLVEYRGEKQRKAHVY
ncbi:hypothetical protein P7C73_g310, partial [Tremellales sp. Uapishka_1]